MQRSVVSFAAILLFASAANAAPTPTSGTISVTQAAPTTWQGGIPAGANQLNGEMLCQEGVTCESFTLTIAGQPSDWAGKIVHVALSWKLPTTEYDVFVHQGSLTGPVIASSANGPGVTSNEVNIDAGNVVVGTGVFVIHASGSQSVTADQYTGTATVSPAPTRPQPAVAATGTPPRFQIFNPSQAQLAAGMGTSSGEPSIGSNWNTGAILYQSDLQTLKVTLDESSCPSSPSALWANVASPFTSQTSLDPILFTDTRTGRTQVSQLAGETSLSAYTDDDGATWIPSQGGGIPSGVDHQTVGGGPFHAPLPSGAIYSDAVYYCTQAIADANCALSVDGGLTFGPAVPIYNLTACGGLHGHVKVGPDGTAYVPNANCPSTGSQAVVVSEDNGHTWTVRGVTSSGVATSDPSVATDRAGTLYFAYADGNAHASVAISKDHGRTFSKIVDVGAPLGVQATELSEMVAGDPGRASMVFLGAKTAGNPEAGNFAGSFHLYVATTYDGGNTWFTQDVTPNDPVQRGPIWNHGGAVIYRNLLDFNDLTIDSKGRLVAAFADGCFDASCVQATGTGNGYTAVASILRQVGGKSLLGIYDNLNTTTVPGVPQLKVLRNGPVASLSWNESNDGGSAVTNYAVYRGVQGGAESFLANASTATSFVDPTVDASATYYYRIVATNAIGSSCGNDEVQSVPAGGTCLPSGKIVGTFAPGAQTGAPANKGQDIRSLTVSEPAFPDGVSRLVLTMNVASLSPLPPDSQWRIQWYTPSSPGYSWYVGMNSDAQGHVTYEYGTFAITSAVVTGVGIFSPIGPPDFASWSPDGTITIGIANGSVGNPTAGDLLGEVTGKAYLVTGAGSRQPLDIATGGSYLVKGAGYCK